MSHRRNTKPLWMLQHCLDAADYRDQLMGSVVKHPDLPTERRIPYKSTKLPRDMVADLDPKPVQVHNVKFWKRRIKDASVSASLNELLEGFVERAKEDSNERVATVARVWHMDSPGEKFKELLKNKQYFEELFGLLRDSPNATAYFITDIVTLVNLEMTDETGRGHGAGAGVKVPLDAVVTGGAVSLVNVGAGAEYHIKREKGRSVTYEEEMIVFLGYRRVRLERVAGTRAKLVRKLWGEKHGYTARDGFDYWPEMEERPVEGNSEPFMSALTPRSEVDRQLGQEEAREEEEHARIVEALGFDVEVVG
jgi:hypothetical protein